MLATSSRTPCVLKTLLNLHFARYLDQNWWNYVKLADQVGFQMANECDFSFSNYSHYGRVIVFYWTRCNKVSTMVCRITLSNNQSINIFVKRRSMQNVTVVLNEQWSLVPQQPKATHNRSLSSNYAF